MLCYFINVSLKFARPSWKSAFAEGVYKRVKIKFYPILSYLNLFEINFIDFQAFMYFCVYFIYYEPLLLATALNLEFDW